MLSMCLYRFQCPLCNKEKTSNVIIQILYLYMYNFIKTTTTQSETHTQTHTCNVCDVVWHATFCQISVCNICNQTQPKKKTKKRRRNFEMKTEMQKIKNATHCYPKTSWHHLPIAKAPLTRGRSHTLSFSPTLSQNLYSQKKKQSTRQTQTKQKQRDSKATIIHNIYIYT